MEETMATLGLFLVQLPVFIVWLVGIILSVVYWRRHPKVSLLALIAITAFFVTSLFGSALTTWLPIMLQRRGWAMTRLSAVLAIVSLVRSIVNAALWGLLIAAIFGWRSERGSVTENGG
jgi:hypothetical protein